MQRRKYASGSTQLSQNEREKPRNNEKNSSNLDPQSLSFNLHRFAEELRGRKVKLLEKILRQAFCLLQSLLHLLRHTTGDILCLLKGFVEKLFHPIHSSVWNVLRVSWRGFCQDLIIKTITTTMQTKSSDSSLKRRDFAESSIAPVFLWLIVTRSRGTQFTNNEYAK